MTTSILKVDELTARTPGHIKFLGAAFNEMEHLPPADSIVWSPEQLPVVKVYHDIVLPLTTLSPVVPLVEGLYMSILYEVYQSGTWLHDLNAFHADVWWVDTEVDEVHRVYVSVKDAASGEIRWRDA